MHIDELERSLQRLAGPPSTLQHDEVHRRARQIRRRRRAGRLVAASACIALGGAFVASRIDAEPGIALDVSSPSSESDTGPSSVDVDVELAPSTETLLDAIRADDLASVRSFLDDGVDIDGPGRFGFTPLMVASIRGNETTVRTLIDRRAALEATSSSGHTALHLAARNGNAEALVTLLDGGASIDARTTNRYGSTALMIAVGHDRRAAIDALIDGGADVSAVDDVGRPLIYYALDNLDVSPDDSSTRDLVEILVEAGATITAPDGRIERLDDRPLDETLDLLIATNSPRQS